MASFNQRVFRFVNGAMRHDLRDTIVVAGSPRSGTTWFTEVLRELPGYKQLNEPLNLNSNPEAPKIGFQWRTCIAPEEDRPKAYTYLENALVGKIHKLHLWRFQSSFATGKLIEHVRRGKIVVKLIRVSRMLHWFASQFQPRRIFFLIRHPCAVVSSRLKYGNWDIDESDDRSFRERVLNSWIPDAVLQKFAATFDDIETHAQQLAVSWCLDYYFPFYEHARESYPWVLVPYEGLVANGRSELDRVLSTINEASSKPMIERLGMASHSASGSLASKDTQQQLSKWKRTLTAKQIDDILRIVNDFELDFYTDDLHPSYDRLMQFQRADAKVSTHA